MPQFIDRRLNPRDKSLGNRMRFLRRTREQLKRAVDKAVRERSISDAAKGGSVSIPSDGIRAKRPKTTEKTITAKTGWAIAQATPSAACLYKT